MPRSLSHQVGILTLGRVLAYAVMFVVPLVNVRALSQEHYGYYRQFWLVFETLTPLLILGFPRSLLYYFPRSEARRDKAVYVTQTLAFLLTMSLVAVGIYAVMAQVLGSGIGAMIRGFFVRLCFFTLFMMVSQYMDSLFVAERQVKRQAVYHVVVAVTQAVVVISSALITRQVSGMIWALSWFAAAKFAFAIGYAVVVYRPSPRLVSLLTLKDQLSFALPLGLAGIALMLVTQADKFIINRFLGREEFAVYVVGAFQLPLVSIIRASINNVVFPLMSQYQKEGDYQAILELWQRALLKTVVMFAPIFVFLMVAAKPFIVILFTKEYERSTPIFVIYLFLFLRSAVESGAIIQVFKKTTYIAKIFLAGFVFHVCLSLILFRLIGREGVALSAVITMYLVNLSNLIYASRLLNTSLRRLFPSAHVVKRLIVAIIPGLPLWLVFRAVVVDNPFELAGLGIAYLALYFVLSAVVGYITVDDVKSMLGKKPL